jgi:mannose/fructose/N-acetylgalactosamine-specific phosphotransferase system component IIB
VNAQRLLVVDDEAAHNPLMRAAMTMAVPRQIQVQLATLDEVDFEAIDGDAVRTLVLFREVSGALAAREHGLPDGELNIGNVHAGNGRHQVTRSVFLTDEERTQLKELALSGMKITMQAVPTQTDGEL